MIISNFHQRLRAIHQRNKDNMPTQVMNTILKTEEMLKRSSILLTSVQVGDQAPDFNFQTSWTDATSLSELLKTGPAILSFYRGFWCSTCREESKEYVNLMPQFTRLGKALVDAQTLHYLAICPQQIIEQNINREAYRLITDVNLQIAKTYGIAYEQPIAEQQVFAGMGFSLATVNKMSHSLLTLPAVYVVSQQGKVIHRKLSTDFRERQDPNELFDLF